MDAIEGEEKKVKLYREIMTVQREERTSDIESVHREEVSGDACAREPDHSQGAVDDNIVL